MKYKSKGVDVNKVGNNYLYRAHCVYDKKTKKNVRVSDGYIGRVTKKDGFTPAKDKVSGLVLVFEFGIYFSLSKITEKEILSYLWLLCITLIILYMNILFFFIFTKRLISIIFMMKS